MSLDPPGSYVSHAQPFRDEYSKSGITALIFYWSFSAGTLPPCREFSSLTILRQPMDNRNVYLWEKVKVS